MKVKRAVKVALTAGVITMATAGPAMATVKYVGGGTWDYGATATTWSNYYHGSVCHGSSVYADAVLVRSPNTAAGYWSYASHKAGLAGNQAYWRNSC
ncbi:bacteriocin%2C lactococcin 972 family [Mycobacterium tuberculosis]|nr:bacteriocin%2C lactococcin 972 family [Mycobacterium tuberculosis]